MKQIVTFHEKKNKVIKKCIFSWCSHSHLKEISIFFKKDILELKYKLYIFFAPLMLNNKGFKVKK